MTVRAAIVGPTGYSGLTLIELLLRHSEVELAYLASARDTLPDIRDEFPQLIGRVDESVAGCRPIDAESMADAADVVFLPVPSPESMALVPGLLDAGLRVIDLSADYRLADPDLYEQTYGHAHRDRANLPDAVYGLPELFRDRLPGAMLVANPGCYPTAAVLGVAPLINHSLVKTDRILVNAASGVTGAGRRVADHTHFPEHNEAFFAYGRIGKHRHQPEINQVLAHVAGHPVNTLLVPHLLPIDRGILTTAYLEPATADVSADELYEAFADAYAQEPFVRVRDVMPNVKHVRHSNFCDLSVHLAGPDDDPTIVVFAAEDNLVKGAAGQAIQNMNIVFELDETAGLL